jgi:putative FmdB family regulatory protein
MPVYEFRCSTCHVVDGEQRPMAEADVPAICPGGHAGAARPSPVATTTGLAAQPLTGARCGAPPAGGRGGGARG